MSIELSVERRAAIHAALGDPGRLAVVDALLVGDAAPGELARRLGIPSNLLAHHINVLQSSGLVRRIRSEADRRRSYVTLEPDAYDAITAAGPVEPDLSASRVLFVCTRNSARSQIAAALWGRCSTLPVGSAGTHPADRVHPGAVAAARRHGMPFRPGRPRDVSRVARADDLLVTVCDAAGEELGELRHVHWSVRDPVCTGTDAAFDETLSVLAGRVARLAGILQPHGSGRSGSGLEATSGRQAGGDHD
ncbi:helix-turn-helix domain-containing protein [Phytoactinopolyspora mesophila]|uniref:Helix-turn-helix domain-containing protein n=1 Tax=Phytoactinopolyspora mesophila TaxID=2650750 RepID=A0A7K3M790_9ACTN|nr:helix-turn-helix domain-containing protein [Phytoactinopolyspora mesophila]NDL59134.1 helix-turn-helix domain-containing protein [Phytoactinopolyspora mesophila]